MNIFKKIYCRSFQTVFKIALPFLPYRKPKIVSALSDIPSVLNKKKKSCPIIITDPGIAKLGILSMLTDVFDNAGIEYHVYDKTVANPTTDTVEEALAIYKDNKCDCIIGFGGGSSMDCAKAVGVRIARPRHICLSLEESLRSMQSFLCWLQFLQQQELEVKLLLQP